MADLQVTPASEWKKAREAGKVFEFPSTGRVARLRPVGADMVLKLGKLPDTLSPLIMEAVFGGGQLNIGADSLKSMEGIMKLLDCLAELAFIEPVCRPNGVAPGENEISVDDLEMEEKFALLGLFGLPARKLEDFRFQQTQYVGDIQSGEDDGAAALVPAGDSGVG